MVKYWFQHRTVGVSVLRIWNCTYSLNALCLLPEMSACRSVLQVCLQIVKYINKTALCGYTAWQHVVLLYDLNHCCDVIFFLCIMRGIKQGGFMFFLTCKRKELFEEISVSCDSVAHEERCFPEVSLSWRHNGAISFSAATHKVQFEHLIPRWSIAHVWQSWNTNCSHNFHVLSIAEILLTYLLNWVYPNSHFLAL